MAKGEYEMKKLLLACVLALALVFTVSASAALVPGSSTRAIRDASRRRS
jgi:hypothetical protein